MELYLDSVKIDEIKQANELGYLTGLTTTPTFMFRDGIKDVDAAMVDISKMVDILQVEALGDTTDEILAEVERLIALGLSKEKTVFKIPISLEGTKACRKLVNMGYQVNLHLVYTLQQAYMAFRAGATYVCPLVGRLQDQGHDALGLVKECVDVVEKYGYQSKIMFSSVRHVEHVKNALNIGVHTCTIPWNVMKQLTVNHFTTLGTQQFIDHTNLLTTKVEEVMRTSNVKIASTATINDALVQMSASKLGAVVVENEEGDVHRIFTDSDLRKLLGEGSQDDVLATKLSDLEAKYPITIGAYDTLMDAQQKFKATQVDCLAVANDNQVVGLLDVQDIV